MNKKHQLSFKYSFSVGKIFKLMIGNKEQITELYLPTGWFCRKLPSWIDKKGGVDFLVIPKKKIILKDVGLIIYPLMKLGFTIESFYCEDYLYFHCWK